MKEKSSIALIGFMATGKTIIGKALAMRLNYNFIETDQMIVENTGKTIPEIFKKEGEEKFRLYETEVCKRVSELKNTIISCGGGVVLEQENMNNLKKNCIIILLKSDPKIIYRRIMKDKREKRPIIDKKNPKKSIEELLKYRKSYYENNTDIIIDTNGKKVEDITKEIIQKIKNFQKNI